ncbi:hypothetical protein BDZ89DRAFT_1069448 [Hymenopellis radicata]|nr:hypothetical protein BDZ89DRAFT_1069448 [Hymenopellis radicata]
MASTTPALRTFRPLFNTSATHSHAVDSGYDSASPHSNDGDDFPESSSGDSSSSDSDNDQKPSNESSLNEGHSDPSSDSGDEPNSWTEGLEAYPSNYQKPVRLRKHIRIGRVGGKRCLPFAKWASFDTFVKSPTIFVDKVAHIQQLCDIQTVDGRLTLIRRPHGFGKTSFLSMVGSVQDLNRREEFCQVYGPSARDEALVLSLNLDKLPSEPRAFRAGFAKHMNSALRGCLIRYRDLLGLSQHEINRRMYDDTQGSAFEWVMEVVALSEYSVVLLIDNLNAPLIKSTKDNIAEIQSIIEWFLLIPVSRAMDDGAITGGFAVSLPFSEEPEWTRRGRTLGFRQEFFNAIAVDNSDSELVKRAFGFSKAEIAGLAAECLSPEDVEPFVNQVVETLPDWFYSYSMSDVLAMLRKRTGQVDYQSPFPFP